ncbi:MAG: NAD(P)-dependent oxidoreductase, partial [Gemmatimonadetes bacterium]|nr:NAD(P)-dependent oxidoreductase [Gemmatimonadota bacterium]NIQ53131.1 NAD(P)-dependent oxidoreductase [Gemmatimonadota bacterium]NIU73278.1 NAD(P)-dependent oxidoreductase [Gammaproteobacteria bacterium]NIX43537.1 NAD(P)-dependent oxidoreductase [Gemmatimonadota bacterium]NIY07719.1 NAD(P)-dependent oxidoreductase [Gemmatimonadota bacterium]
MAWVVRRESGEGTFDEDTLPDPPQLIRSAVDGEGIARDAGERHGFTVGVLRGGWLYGPIPQTRMVVDLLRKRRLPVIGRGDFLVAPIHIDDLAAAFAVAAESDREGTWNVVDDEPLRFASLVRRIAELAGAPQPRTVPGWVARLLLGGPVYESMTTSMDTSNARIRAELGWAPAHPTLRQGL